MAYYDLIVVTTPTVSGREITRVLGPVYGITVRSRGVGGQIVAGLQTLAGGEISMYTK